MIDYVHELLCFAFENSFVYRVYGWKRKTYRADFADRLSLLGIVHAVFPEIIYGEHENEDDSKDSHLYASKHAFEPIFQCSNNGNVNLTLLKK